MHLLCSVAILSICGTSVADNAKDLQDRGHLARAPTATLGLSIPTASLGLSIPTPSQGDGGIIIDVPFVTITINPTEFIGVDAPFSTVTVVPGQYVGVEAPFVTLAIGKTTTSTIGTGTASQAVTFGTALAKSAMSDGKESKKVGKAGFAITAVLAVGLCVGAML